MSSWSVPSIIWISIIYITLFMYIFWGASALLGFHPAPQTAHGFSYLSLIPPLPPLLFHPHSSRTRHLHLEQSTPLPFPNEKYLLPLAPYCVANVCGSMGCSVVIIDWTDNTPTEVNTYHIFFLGWDYLTLDDIIPPIHPSIYLQISWCHLKNG